MAKCTALTIKGTECKKNAGINGVCYLHDKKDVRETTRISFNFSQVSCEDEKKRIPIPNNESYQNAFRDAVETFLKPLLRSFPYHRILSMGKFDIGDPILSLNNVIVETSGVSSIIQNPKYLARDISPLVSKRSIQHVSINGRDACIIATISSFIHNDKEVDKLIRKSSAKDWYLVKLKLYITNKTTAITRDEFLAFIKANVLDEIELYFYMNFDYVDIDAPTDYQLDKDVIIFKVYATRYQLEKLINIIRNESLEDGPYEGNPGTGFVIESKEHPGEEGGLVDYRDKISYKKIK